MRQRPWMRPVPRLPPKVLSGNSPSSSVRPSWTKSSASPSLHCKNLGFETIDRRGREAVVDLSHVDVLRAEAGPLAGQLRGAAALRPATISVMDDPLLGGIMEAGRREPGAPPRGTRFDCRA